MMDSESDSMLEDVCFSSDMEDISNERGDWVIVERGMDSDGMISDWECFSDDSYSIRQEMQSLHLNEELEIDGPERSFYQNSNHVAEFTRRINQTRGTCIEEVVREHVLPLLPAKTLCRFRTVCKAWNQWISSPFLAHKQAVQYQQISGFFCQKPGYDCYFIPLDPETHGMPDPYLTFMPGPVNIRSICRGLLCVQGIDDPYYICNPVTKNWKMLPPPNFYHGPQTAVSLAFEPSLFNFPKNFELVCAVPVTDAGLVFEIFSSRSRSWRASQDICFDLVNATFMRDGYYRDGSVYWVVDCGVILVFNLKIDHYSIVQLPDGSSTDGTLTETHGELCYMVALKESSDLAIYIYKGMDMSSRHRICIPWAYSGNVARQVGLMGCVDGDVLLVCIGNVVISHRVSTGETRMLGVDRMRGECTVVKYLPYMDSLVHVNELSEPCDYMESMHF